MSGRDSTSYKPCSSWSCVGHSFTIWFKEPGKLVTHLRSRARLHLCAVCRLAEQNDGVMLILLRSPFTERWEPSTGRRCVGDFGEGYKLQAVQFLKLRRSLIYDLIQGSWKVGHSFMKSSEVTVMRSRSASRIERRCYAYSFAVTNHRTLSAGHWSKMCGWHRRRRTSCFGAQI